MCDILLLEDDPLARETMAELLSDTGLHVREAGSVMAAQAILRETDGCRLLIADHNLGNQQDVDGFAFAVGAMRLMPALRVIYTTGRSDLLDGKALTPRERTLAKPFRGWDLLNLAKDMLLEE